MSHPIADIAGIEQEMVATLKSHGIRTTAKLLEAAKNPKGRKALSEKTGIDEKRLLCWANMADRMRIKGVGEEYANLLQAAGVDTVKELANRNSDNLYEAVQKFDLTISPIVRRKPGKASVVAWIKQAKRLKPTLTY